MRKNDNEFWYLALAKWLEHHPERAGAKLGDMTRSEFSDILQLAQELKIANRAVNPLTIEEVLNG